MKKLICAMLALCMLLILPGLGEGLTVEDEATPTADPAPRTESATRDTVSSADSASQNAVPSADPAPRTESAAQDTTPPAADGMAVNVVAQDPSQGGSALAPQGTVPSVVAELAAQELPLYGVKIGIDPGHQAHGNSERETVAPNSSEKKAKVSSGTTGVYTRIPEYITVLEISLKLREALESQGAQVYMTRESHDVDISNQERAKMMNDYGVDLVLRIHCDGVDSHSKRGIALYCSRSNAIAEESYRACEAILPAVCAATGAESNGIVRNDNYTGQNWSTVPCLMVECGFMSNPDEDVLLNDEDYQWKLATGLTEGIMAYIAQRDAD